MRLAVVIASLIIVSLTRVKAEISDPVVYPSGATVPQRLLRISIEFAEPQSERIYQQMQLRDSRGRKFESPFADPPLWSADNRTLTLLLDPSRQKTGLRNHSQFGFVLPIHDDVTLTLRGLPLKTWYVADEACPPLAPRNWRILPVRLGTRDMLRVVFPGPIDKLSAYAFLIIRGRDALPGEGTLVAHETQWKFHP